MYFDGPADYQVNLKETEKRDKTWTLIENSKAEEL